MYNPSIMQSRNYISIFFRCCSVYSRIYRNADQTRYVGYCPRCMRKVEVKIDPQGTNQRFFEAY